MKKVFTLSLITIFSLASINSFACEHHDKKKTIVTKAKTATEKK